jgi:hypothetical protein
MAELAQDILPFVHQTLQEERDSREKRRAVESLTNSGSFHPHRTRQILESAKSEQKEFRKIPRYVFQGFGVGGGSALDVLLGSTPVSRIAEARLRPLQEGKVIYLLSRENVFGTSLFANVTPRLEGPAAPVRDVYSQVEGQEIHIHPLRTFAADPIPTIRRSIHLREEIKSAMPPDDMPRQLSVRVSEEAE